MSGFLLDTSFLSVLGNPGRPCYGPALRWYQSNDERDLFTCAIVIGEIARGINAPASGPAARALSPLAAPRGAAGLQ